MTDQQRKAYVIIASIWFGTFALTVAYGQSAIDGVRSFAQTARYNVHQAYHQRFNLNRR